MRLSLSFIVAAFVNVCRCESLQLVLQEEHRFRVTTRVAASNSLLPTKCALRPPGHEIDYEAGYTLGDVPSPPLQIQPLIVSGPSSNRVDLVFFSDGYTVAEHEKFLVDAARLAADISGNQTFSTVKPLLNFWAAFSPSRESGIGKGGVPKDTPFGLYRYGTELRGVYYSKPEVAKAACSSLGNQCNYPILLGNDPLYGGLGGDFTVITSSLANGPLVLRHELGHSIISVGEEYDGGFAYFGPNAAHDLLKPIPWTHWFSDPQKHESGPHVERSIMPMQEYPWTMLNTSTPWSTKFRSFGAYSRHLIRFSLSGIPERSDLKVELDGSDLGWVPWEGIGLDRWHYDVHRKDSLSPGEHEVKFTLIDGNREGTAQLCSVEIIEFGNEDEFMSTAGYYGIFRTFSDKNETSYRPTNDDCLMRTVTTPNFCKVCLEGLWLSLLRRVNLIDDIQESCRYTDSGAPVKTLDMKLVSLAQFRQNAKENKNNESYTIVWQRNNQILHEFTNKTRLEIEGENAVGEYTIGVKFATDEVRVDKDKLLTVAARYEITHNCGAQQTRKPQNYTLFRRKPAAGNSREQ